MSIMLAICSLDGNIPPSDEQDILFYLSNIEEFRDSEINGDFFIGEVRTHGHVVLIVLINDEHIHDSGVHILFNFSMSDKPMVEDSAESYFDKFEPEMTHVVELFIIKMNATKAIPFSVSNGNILVTIEGDMKPISDLFVAEKRSKFTLIA